MAKSNNWPEVVGTKVITVDGQQHTVTVYASQDRRCKPVSKLAKHAGRMHSDNGLLAELADLRRRLAEIAKHA